VIGRDLPSGAVGRRHSTARLPRRTRAKPKQATIPMELKRTSIEPRVGGSSRWAGRASTGRQAKLSHHRQNERSSFEERCPPGGSDEMPEGSSRRAHSTYAELERNIVR
jgi:hypothetical protein